MPYSYQVIRYLQQNNILANQLDHAVSGVKEAVLNQIEMTGAGARRLLYYTSCFTDEYKDVCQQQKTEDIRFAKGVYHLLRHEDVIYEMLNIYFNEILRYKTSEQLQHIKHLLMATNIHIAASSLTNLGFASATATAVSLGLNFHQNIAALAGRMGGGIVMATGFYGIVQKAADSAQSLYIESPIYYQALHTHELEMMYFLIDPLFKRAEVFQHVASDENIANIITRMIR